MDPRERWHQLQAHLNAARGHFQAGRRPAALEEIDAALALDPGFLAAQTLRDQIVSCGPDSDPGEKLTSTTQIRQPVGASPLVSAEGWAQFEARAKQRRLDRRLAAARSAIAHRDADAARLALGEVLDLSPAHPDLPALNSELERIERERSGRLHLGPAFAAAATFAALVFSASWIEETTGLLSYPFTQIAELVDPVPSTPVATLVADELLDIGTAGRDLSDDAAAFVAGRSVPDAAAGAVRAATTPSAVISAQTPPPLAAGPNEVSAAAFEPPTSPAAPPPAPAALPPAVSLASNVIPADVPPPSPPPAARTAATVSRTIVPPIDDERQVHDALQRYRAAYDDLDARSAQAVWPAVNGPALARAFDSLSSQSLTFESCNVELTGPAATAVCRGSARYVPKVGSREPRVESRVWNFTLRKAGDDWQIESARAAR